MRILLMMVAILLFGNCSSGDDIFAIAQAEPGERPVLDTPIEPQAAEPTVSIGTVKEAAAVVSQAAGPIGCTGGDCSATVTLSCPQCDPQPPAQPVMMQSYDPCSCVEYVPQVSYRMVPQAIQTYAPRIVQQAQTFTLPSAPQFGHQLGGLAGNVNFGGFTGDGYGDTGVMAWDMDEDGGVIWDMDPPRRRFRLIKKLIRRRSGR